MTTTTQKETTHMDTCTCPMSLRTRGEHSVACPQSTCQHHPSWITDDGCAMCAAADAERREADRIAALRAPVPATLALALAHDRVAGSAAREAAARPGWRGAHPPAILTD